MFDELVESWYESKTSATADANDVAIHCIITSSCITKVKSGV